MSIKTTYYQGNDVLAVVLGPSDPDGLHASLPELSLLTVEVEDWNRQLSPWKASRVFRQEPDFAGEADQFLKETTAVVSEVQSSHAFKHILIAGYSLAGLASLYACTKDARYEGCVSASGSLWFPGFLDYLKQHPVQCTCVYLSVGSQERHAKNKLLSQVEDCTGTAAHILEEQGKHACFALNPGNHFVEETSRLAKGIAWVNQQLQDASFD